MSDVKISIIQEPPVFLNLGASLDRAGSLARAAAAEGADVVVFPETWLPGYPVWLDHAPGAALWDHGPARELFRVLFENSAVAGGPAFSRLAHVAREASIILVMGVNERVGATLHNTLAIFDGTRGRSVLHRKLMPTYSERMLWGCGDGSTLNVLPTADGNIGGLICWEHWMPLARATMHAFGEALHVAQWPTVKELNVLASRHYAFEGQCFVAAAGCVLHKGEILDGYRSVAGAGRGGAELLKAIPGGPAEAILRGGSCVIGPDAAFLLDPAYGGQRLPPVDVDLAVLPEGRLVLDTHGHYSRPDVFRLLVDDRPKSNVCFRSAESSEGSRAADQRDVADLEGPEIF